MKQWAMVIRRFVFSDSIFYSLVILLIFLLLVIPLIVKIKATPPNYFYTLAQGYYLDYDYYLSIMRQGKTQWLTSAPYTTEEEARSFLHIFYLYVGKLAALLGIPDPIMYYLSLYTSLAVFIVAVLWLTYQLFPPTWRRIAFLFIFLASSLPPIELTSHGLKIITPYPWWVPLGSSYHRLAFVPHHLFAQGLMVVSLILWLRFIKRYKFRLLLLLLATLSQLIGIIIFPPPGIVLAVAVIGSALLSWNKGEKGDKGEKEKRKILIGAALLFLGSIAAFLFIQWQVKSQVSWQAEFTKGARYYRRTFPIEQILFDYTKVFGVLWLFIPWGALFLCKKEKSKWHAIAYQNDYSFQDPFILNLFLFLSPFILMPIVSLTGGDSYRLIGAAPFVAAGILATYGSMILVDRLKKRLGKYISFLPVVFLTIVILGSLPGWVYFYRTEIIPEWSTNVYLPNEWVRAFTFLAKNIPRGLIVLSREHVGALLPVFTDSRPFIAHADLTYRFFEKKEKVEAFYKKAMSKEEAQAFLSQNNIDYVYWGWYESDLAKEPEYQDLLELIFRQGTVSVYQVK